MSELETTLRAFRASLSAEERDIRLRMRRAYRAAIQSLQGDLRRAQERIAELQADGKPVPRWRLLQEGRIRQLIAQTELAFSGFGQTVSREVILRQQAAVRKAQGDALRLIEAGFGPGPVGARLPLVTLPEGALRELVGALQPESPLSGVLRSFAGDAAKVVEDQLVSGMAAGKNSRDIARSIVRQLGVSRTRAETIVRTELHRRYRNASLAVMREQGHLLKGWRWSAAKSPRTCAACLALDGRIFELNEPARNHVNCRCSVVPVPKSWKSLGYDIPEPMVRRQSGADWFATQPVSIQREVLGVAAQAEYEAGAVELGDFVSLRRSRIWGSSYVRGSLEGALERAGKRERRAA